jgi:hypothetical protein
MRNRIWIAICAMMCLVFQVHAHAQADPTGPDLARAELLLTAARRDVFEHAMKLNDNQKDTFWNLYTDYDRQRAKLTDETAQLLRSYVTDYDTLTDQQATKMMDEAARIIDQEVKLRRKYADAISKKLGGRVGARFYQIDEYLDTAVRLQLLEDIPFVRDRQGSDTAHP